MAENDGVPNQRKLGRSMARKLGGARQTHGNVARRGKRY